MNYNYCPVCGRELVERKVENHVRPACPDDACGFVHFDNPTPVVAAVVQRDECVILIQNEGWPEDWYGLVSGFLEPNEDPDEAMLREVREELNLDGSIEERIGLYPFERRNQLLIVYHVTVDNEPVPGEELADLREVPVDKLKPWDFGTGPALADWLDAHHS